MNDIINRWARPLLPDVWKFVACEDAAIDIHPEDKVVYCLYPACPVDNQPMIFSVARRGHMMWGGGHLVDE